jgi:hypothetical protein
VGTDAIDTLVRNQRDTGELKEPLATSVLEYSLRLRPDIKSQEQGRTIHDIERMLHSDPLLRVIDREYSRRRSQQAFPNDTSLSVPESSPNPRFSHPNMASRLCGETLSPFSGDLNSTLPDVLQESNSDWWQVNFDDLTQTMLSHNDLFNLDLWSVTNGRPESSTSAH